MPDTHVTDAFQYRVLILFDVLYRLYELISVFSRRNCEQSELGYVLARNPQRRSTKTRLSMIYVTCVSSSTAPSCSQSFTMKRTTGDPVSAQRTHTKRTKRSPPTRDEFSLRSIQEATKVLSDRLLPAETCEELLGAARSESLTVDGASWVYYIPGWYKQLHSVLPGSQDLAYDEWVDALWDLHPRHRETIKMFGKDVLLPRFQRVYGQSCRSSGRFFEAKPFPTLLDGPVQCLQALVIDAKTGETLTRAGLVNWYQDGDQYVGPHADDENHIHAHSPVFSISFGATRKFVFTPRDKASENARQLEMMLHDGDLLVMGGTTQTTHKHALPRMKACTKKRISFTMRCFKQLNKATG